MAGDIKITKTDQGIYKVEIEGEDHTIGNLLSTVLQTLKGVNIAYYEVPHPLENRLIIYMDLDENIDPKDKLIEALQKIKEMNEEFKKKYIEKIKEMNINIEI
ncbi:DNA-directed RNA polymerase, subunit L [Caldisphaera lagunensis DSM 15908]|uniref:DNA-directed RNA polymerase subunit Rpo11 n=1 Tax=Caldisphaera lagunensis (strain DSM 15908 / JCM 11604 / ANMR 0165 / IC-154) TaxID=1056495 RepID=L0ACU8_CALLD|nr:DNA-directed RNA polymerase subunit L [Caldisphaera lagunensis]AFZ70880.1 DNA-directed RNA polymerase, subunit L [Caldisphaera lagunensis DSM 15908]